MDFDKVYNEHHKNVLGFLIKKTFDVVVSEELANDVFMRVYKHQESFDSNIASLNTWIYNISNRILIDYFRKKKLLTTSLNNDDENDNGGHFSADYILGHAVVHTSTPHLELVTKETMKQAQKAITTLPKNYRRVCNLYFNHNYRMNDIAVMTKKPLNTVKGDIHKARAILQKQLVKI
jgi:RNA polymerase sigma-70 factor (ECF subfamily)